MSDFILEVHPRPETGSNASRRFREQGEVPAVVYGAGKDTVPILVHRKSILDLFKKTGSEHSIFLLRLGDTGKERHCMIKEMQVDPITRRIEHIDFLRIVMTEKIRVSLPVELVGEPVGVKNEGGLVDFVSREVEVECLPANLPASFALDISGLHVGQHLEAKDLSMPKGVELVTEPERVIVSLAASRVGAAEEGEAEEAGLLTESGPEEPEVIGRASEGEEEG